MGKYGNVAVLATTMVQNRECTSPVEAWEVAARKVFPTSEASRKKGCPKGAYLGLCEAGLVSGVSRGDYTRSIDNKRYAIEAVRLLKRNPDLADASARDGGANRLWFEVMKNDLKRSNGQMEVVLALWNTELIARS